MPQLEAWQMVLVNETFLTSTHGQLGCTTCHRGNSDATDKEAAHVELIAAPSDSVDQFCGSCHAEIVSDHRNSLHGSQAGFFKRIENRLGYDISTDPHLLKEFKNECGKCHTSCGQCHISRPVTVKGGFVDGHNFYKQPSMRDNCTACHGSRVGAEYFGENEGIRADVHWIPNVKHCTFCHDADAMHASSDDATYRYEDKDMVGCTDCHSEAATANEFHNLHWDIASCQVCHSQPYKSCNGCHVGGEGITGSSYMTFKIGRNPIQSPDRPYRAVTVRHIPIVRDTYAAWGIGDLPNFDAEPTWKYATPHNIQRWTDQTSQEGVSSCDENCHNTDLFLTADDVDPDELEANKNVIYQE